ncbi:MAG: hypothetical protein IJ055_10520 [Oscillospiraceae bacterium]|nr:hypothetical protein [Oscillospiraceae bacterium]
MKLILASPVIVSVLCIVLGLVPELHPQIRHRRYVRARVTGSAVQRVHRRGSGEMRALAPRLRFETDEGPVDAVSRRFLPEWQYSYRTGEEIRICYDARNPSLCEPVRHRHSLRRPVCLCVGIGTLIAYTALAVQYYGII